MLDPEGLTPHHIRVHLEHVGVQQVSDEMILLRWRVIQDHCLRRKRWNYSHCCWCITSWSEKPGDSALSPFSRNNGRGDGNDNRCRRHHCDRRLCDQLDSLSCDQLDSLSCCHTYPIGRLRSALSRCRTTRKGSSVTSVPVLSDCQTCACTRLDVIDEFRVFLSACAPHLNVDTAS